MTKVIMIQDTISNYSVPVFNAISKQCDFTVLYNDGNLPPGIEFNTIRGDYNSFGIVNKYDVLICSPNFQNIKLLKLISKFGRKKVIYYGIGVSASYKHPYDSNKIVGLFFSLFLRWIGAAVFYSSYPKNKYKKLGVREDKMFVANNTTYVLKSELSKNKEYMLFVGSLYKEKGIDILIKSYNKAYSINKKIPNLLIVGEGDEYKNIEEYIKVNDLTCKIKLLGAIYDENKLKQIYKKAIACISPKQAGLSVLKSMGYGVPFITHNHAITGGELFNINDNNGVIYDNHDDLYKILLEIYDNSDKFLNMGEKAKEYYYQNCTIDIMANGFMRAIYYVENN